MLAGLHQFLFRLFFFLDFFDFPRRGSVDKTKGRSRGKSKKSKKKKKRKDEYGDLIPDDVDSDARGSVIDRMITEMDSQIQTLERHQTARGEQHGVDVLRSAIMGLADNDFEKP